jgi:uncharacterized protein (DUF1810 family)
MGERRGQLALAGRLGEARLLPPERRSNPGMNDPHVLQRFVSAQESEFRLGSRGASSWRKTSHWMWYVFPQIEGLGYSSTSQKFAIKSKAEALAYLAHRCSGLGWKECTEIVNALHGSSAHQIFGSPDDMKFRSSMTLFHKNLSRNGQLQNSTGKNISRRT